MGLFKSSMQEDIDREEARRMKAELDRHKYEMAQNAAMGQVAIDQFSNPYSSNIWSSSGVSGTGTGAITQSSIQNIYEQMTKKTKSDVLADCRIRKADNGFIVEMNGSVYICPELTDVGEQIIAHLVSTRLEN